jgi:hypothetical protein
MVFYLLFDIVVVNVRKREPDDMAEVVDHVVYVLCRLFTVWVDWRLPCAGEMVSVLDGCSEFGLDHGCIS